MKVALFMIALVVGTEAFAPAVRVMQKPTATFTGTALEMGPRNDPPTAETGVKAVGFLGAAAACLGLIVLAPFADVESPGAMPAKAPKEVVQKTSKPKNEKAEKKKVEKTNRALKTQGYNF